MSRVWSRWLWHALAAVWAAYLLQSGCVTFMNEQEVLRRSWASPELIWDSYLVEWFGPRILNFW